LLTAFLTVILLRGSATLSELSWYLLSPGLRLAMPVVERTASSESGANNMVGLILVSFPLNLIVYSIAFFAVLKTANILKRASR
jgi:hypothetical protein